MTALKSGSSRGWPARHLLAAWLIMTLLAILATLAVGDLMRRGIFDSWQSARPRDLSATDVRVVMIDDASIEMIGPWQWPRYYLARLTEELAARQARVIAFDIMFPERDRVRPETFVSLYPELSPGAAAEVKALQPMDELFGQVIGASPVVLAHAGVAEAPAEQPPLPDAPITGKPPPSVPSWPAELAAIPELDEVALGHGLINVPPDVDGVMRGVPLVMVADGRPRPGFAAEIARNVLGAQTIAVTASGVRIGDREVPLDRDGRMRFRFGAFPPDRIISAASVLGKDKQLKADEFAGKAVVIGVTAEGSSDIAATPIAAEEFGPLIQAQAVDAILRGGWLKRPSWIAALEWALAGLLALLALGNLKFGRGYRIALAAIFAAIPVASWLVFTSASLLFDPARPLMVGGGAIAGVAMGLFAMARSERERLRETLVQERIATAETEGELQAARAIQLGMVPPRERLRSLDPRVELDAVLEPARSIGGDYYDAMKLGDDRIGFAVADVTGKGVPAALFMAMSKALTSAALSRMEPDPAAIAAAINAELLLEATSVTMLLGILDLRSGEVRMVSAGHEDPWLITADGTASRLRLDGGLPLCVAELPYPVECVTLRPGDILVLVTDGVTEAENAKGEFFGRDRTPFSRELRAANATEIVEAVRADVREFEAGAEASDDLTVMAVRYLGAR